MSVRLALARPDEFRVHELFTLADDLPAHRWRTFHGQSASLVKYLVDHSGEQRFVEFMRLAQDVGYEQGLRQVYQFGVAELERRWYAQLRATAPRTDSRWVASSVRPLVSAALVVSVVKP